MGQYNITEQEAIDLTTAWRGAHPNMTRAFKIDKAEIDQIFANEPNAVGIRTYLGLNTTTNQEKLVIVGVDNLGKDILTAFYDHVNHCPSNCDSSSPLNS